MLFYSRKGWVVVCVALVIILLFVFHNALLFEFQRWRLGKLGCDLQVPATVKSPDQLTGCEKLWAHRVNSYERFKKLRPWFAGVETDVVFDPVTKNFNIHHPPGPPSQLFLDKFLSDIRGSATMLWIDVKNIGRGDIPGAVKRFKEYDRLYGIKKNIIVESSSPKMLNALAENDFEVSFLVPAPLLISASANNKSHGELPALSPAVRFVSQEDRYVHQLKQLYPKKKILTWSLSFDNYFNLTRLRTLMADSSVQVVLINVKSANYR